MDFAASTKKLYIQTNFINRQKSKFLLASITKEENMSWVHFQIEKKKPYLTKKRALELLNTGLLFHLLVDKKLELEIAPIGTTFIDFPNHGSIYFFRDSHVRIIPKHYKFVSEK